MKKEQFKRGTFVEGTPDECVKMFNELEESGYEIDKSEVADKHLINHIWYTGSIWIYGCDLKNGCNFRLTQDELYKIIRKEQNLDFNILNDTDIFFIKVGKLGNDYLVQGNIPEDVIGWSYYGKNYFEGPVCHKFQIKAIRKATPEEIEPHKNYFKLNVKNIKFNPSNPFEVSDDGITWVNKEFTYYIGVNPLNQKHVISRGSGISEWRYIRNIEKTKVKLSDIEGIIVNGETLTNFEIEFD